MKNRDDDDRGRRGLHPGVRANGRGWRGWVCSHFIGNKRMMTDKPRR